MGLKIVRGRRDVPAKVVIYSPPGLGKSTLASQCPRPIFLDTERSTSQLDVDPIDIADWTELLGTVHSLCRDAEGYQTVVIDTIDWAERLAVESILRAANKQSIEDFGFGRGYVHLAEAIGKLLHGCDALVSRGINVVMLAHSKVVRVSPPDLQDGYDRYELKLSKQVAPLIKEWPDALLFGNYRTITKEGSDGRTKAINGRDRLMHCNHTAAWDAKNRYGLPDVMPWGYEQIAGIFSTISSGGNVPSCQPAPAIARGATPGPEGDVTVMVRRQPQADAPAVLLVDQITAYIADANNERTLKKIEKRIDALLAENQITGAEWSRLTDLITGHPQWLQGEEVWNG